MLKAGDVIAPDVNNNDEHDNLVTSEVQKPATLLTEYPSNLWLCLNFKRCMIALMVCLCAGLVYSQVQNLKFQKLKGQAIQHIKQKKQLQSGSAFPRIVWIYTQNQFQAQSMYTSVYLYYLNDTAARMGYEVRFVNSWSGYDYISEQLTGRISHAMQNTKIDEGVHNLIKLALLLEHGGIMINLFDTVILSESFKWVQDLLDTEYKENYMKWYNCPPQISSLLLYRIKGKNGRSRYVDYFVAAKPNNQLIRDAFSVLETLIVQGSCPYALELGVLERNEDTTVMELKTGLQSSVNIVLYRYQKENAFLQRNICTRFGLQSLVHPNFLSLSEMSANEQQKIILQPNYVEMVKAKGNGSAIDLLFNVNQKLMTIYLNHLTSFINTKPSKQMKGGSILQKILSAVGNKEVFFDSLPKRQVELCLIIMQDLSATQIKEAFNAFDNQTYTKWKLVIPSNDQFVQLRNNRVNIMPGKGNKVHNIEKACTKYCDPKGYAVLLNFRQNFNKVEALKNIALAVEARDVVGALIRLEQNEEILYASRSYSEFNRGKDGIVNPKIEHMQKILNHFRVFSIQCFRYIPQFDLRDIHGKYVEDRMIFLMTLLELVRAKIQRPEMLYLAKKYSGSWNIPNKVQIVNPNAMIKVQKLETIDREQLLKTRARLQCESMYQTLTNIIKWKIPFSKLLGLNPGNDFVPIQRRRGQQLIPKMIHQVWLGSDRLPPAKAYFYKKTKMMYPGYQLKLWRQQNITKQNFPMTYDVIRTILQFNKGSPYNKLATVTDVMRHQILYHEGGFWKDAGMNMLRPIFDEFRRYKLVIPVDRTFRYRWLQGMCFFGNMPGYENMLRITNFRNINRMRIYHRYAISIAGPIDFRQLLVGQEEYDADILVMPYETFYPAQVTEHPQKDRCTKRKEELMGEEYQIVENGWYLLSDCDKMYPYAFAVEHNRFGDSWPKRRVIAKL